MPYKVKSYGVFSPHYAKLYGDFGRGLKVIHRRVITEREVDPSEDLPDSLDGLPAEPQGPEDPATECSYESCTTFLLLAWKQTKSRNSTRRYYVLLEFQNNDLASEGNVLIYKVYSSKHKQGAEQALQDIRSSLEPFSMIPLSEELIKNVILPQPMDTLQLQELLSEYITKKVPKNPKDWRNILDNNKDSLNQHAMDPDAVSVLDAPHNGHQLIVGDSVTGTTIIHLAVKQGHKYLRETLEALQCQLPQQACIDLINRSNKDGFSTVIKPRRRSVAVLVSVKSFSIEQQDGKDSEAEDTTETVIKTQGSGKVYSLELGAVTPLMLSARQNSVRCVHYLLIAGANPNYQDSNKGMTALHIAAVLCSVSVVKLLLCFEADLTLTDADGRTPLDIVSNRCGKEAEDCMKVMQRIQELRAVLSSTGLYAVTNGHVEEEHVETPNESIEALNVISGKAGITNDKLSDDNIVLSATVHLDPQDSSSTNDNTRKDEGGSEEVVPESVESEEEVRSKPRVSKDDFVTLLSFDGGGTRGSLSAFMLYQIEQKMRQISRDPDLQISQYFNWYAGTSIGSFLALGMSHSNFTTSSLMAAIVNNRDEIFAGRRIYSSVPIVEYGQRILGEADIKSISDPRVLVTTVKADRDPPSLYFITNYREKTQEDERDWKVWEAARASTAAPLYFHAFEGAYVDGSILAVVPTLHAMTDIQTYDKDRRLKLVLSLGTGEIKTDTQLSYLKVPKPPNFFSTIKSNYEGVIALIMAAVTSTDPTINNCRAWCEMGSIDFHRLSPPLSTSIRIDAKSDPEFVIMFYETYIYCLENGAEIERIAKSLLELGPRYHQQQ